MASHPQIYSAAYYERLYALEEGHWWFRGLRGIAAAMLAPHLAGRAGLTALDAGCGTGIVMSQLAGLAPGARVVGLDVAPEALAFCRERGHDLLALASALSLPFPDESFDLIVSADVIQHLPREGVRMALAECARTLKPGGRLYLRTNTALGRGDTFEEEDYRRYRPGELRAEIAAAGLWLERLTYANALPSLYANARRRLGRGPVARVAATRNCGLHVRPLPASLAPLGAVLEGILRLEGRWLARPGRRIPFGHSLIALARRPVDVAR